MKSSTEEQETNTLDKAKDSVDEDFKTDNNRGKRRRAILFMLVGVWALYNYGVRGDLNLPWLVVSLALIIVSAYNFNSAKNPSNRRKQVVDED